MLLEIWDDKGIGGRIALIGGLLFSLALLALFVAAAVSLALEYPVGFGTALLVIVGAFCLCYVVETIGDYKYGKKGK